MDDLQYNREQKESKDLSYVLNLVINGWPSIPEERNSFVKWYEVLNLVINGWPSILYFSGQIQNLIVMVLNLVINGWPSILY